MPKLRVLEFVRAADGAWELPEPERRALVRRFPEVRFDSPADAAGADRALPEADVVLGGAVRPHNFASAARLRWIHVTSAGVGPALFPELAASGVILTNARGLHAVSMAEHVLAAMLGFARRFHLARDAQREGRWSFETFAAEPGGVLELQGASLGLFGFGRVGAAIAERARALGLTVRAVSRRPRPDPSPAHELWPPERLGDLAAASDWFVIAAPLTAATRGAVGRAVLERLPAHAVLVNVGRGSLVDEAALTERLESGALAGAALDVFAEEPLPRSSRLWNLPQVILTPHVSGLGPRYWERAMEQFAENLRAFLDGRPLANVVDKREGY